MRAPRQLNRQLRLAAAAVLSLATLWVPSAVSASCLAPVPGAVPWADADAVFVGTVTSVANGDRWATVRVEEVWQGPDQPAEVVVRGGSEGNAATSIDRTYAVGGRYIFAVTIEGDALLDNACSGTTPAADVDLVAVRPSVVRTVGRTPASTSDGIDLGGAAGPLAVAAIVGGLLLATVLLARRREA